MTAALNIVNEDNNVNTVNNNTDMSTNIADIASALSSAQAELESAGKGTSGYGYNYSDLATVIQTAKPVLQKFNLAVTQLVGNDNSGNPAVTTILTHSSGQFFRSVASMPAIEMKGCNTAQQMGATISYLRRYAFQAILGMASEDNDASSNGFSKSASSTSTASTAKKTEVTETEKSGSSFRRRRRSSNDSDDI
jgi:hypothetical protein